MPSVSSMLAGLAVAVTLAATSISSTASDIEPEISKRYFSSLSKSPFRGIFPSDEISLHDALARTHFYVGLYDDADNMIAMQSLSRPSTCTEQQVSKRGRFNVFGPRKSIPCPIWRDVSRVE